MKRAIAIATLAFCTLTIAAALTGSSLLPFVVWPWIACGITGSIVLIRQ